VLAVVEHRPARGTPERVFALLEGAVGVRPEELESATADEHMNITQSDTHLMISLSRREKLARPPRRPRHGLRLPRHEVTVSTPDAARIVETLTAGGARGPHAG